MKNKLFSKSETRKSVSIKNVVPEGPADFETAVSALGFGKFNVILLLVLIPCNMSIVYETSIISYISPVAQCDLNLTLSDKGMLNAASYIGALVGAIFWGFLIDTLGRKKLLTFGFLIEAVVVLFTGFSQNLPYMIVLKLIGGAMVGGLYIALCTYMCEFHSIEYRGKIQMTMGFMANCGLVLVPLLGAYFLPLKFNVVLFDGYLQFHAWNLYIAITSIMPLMAGVAFIFLPESPKFLMSKGHSDEALNIFKKVYSINSRQPEDRYPIIKLIHETNEESSSEGERVACVQYLKNGWQQMAPLSTRQYLPKLILTTVIQTFLITGMNTLRGWLPQIYQSIHEYQTNNNGTTANLCVTLEGLKVAENLVTSDDLCTVNVENNFSVYLNSMINAFVSMGGYLVAGTLINILGRNTLLAILGTVNTITIMTTYFSTNTATVLVLTSLNMAAGGICFDVVMTMIVVIFPTTLRAMAISATLFIGRTGAIVGNIAFPLLLQLGCAPPFFVLATIALSCTVLCFFLPNTDKDSLK